jgi:cytoskeletal protein CcmA (bactofilin family)
MFNSIRATASNKDKGAATHAVEVPAAAQSPAIEPPLPRSDAATPTRAEIEIQSCIGSGMSIVGKMDCKGPVQVFGRIEGELHASDLLIGKGGEIEGNVVAQDVTICGRLKGTVRALRVRLEGGGAVEGNIFHRTLSIDESSLFEGWSHRSEDPINAAADLTDQQKENMTPRAPLSADDVELSPH